MYKEKRRGDTKPHIFATSDIAFHDMLEMRENQSILITYRTLIFVLALKMLNTDAIVENLAQERPKTPKRSFNISPQ